MYQGLETRETVESQGNCGTWQRNMGLVLWKSSTPRSLVENRVTFPPAEVERAESACLPGSRRKHMSRLGQQNVPTQDFDP